MTLVRQGSRWVNSLRLRPLVRAIREVLARG